MFDPSWYRKVHRDMHTWAANKAEQLSKVAKWGAQNQALLKEILEKKKAFFQKEVEEGENAAKKTYMEWRRIHIDPEGKEVQPEGKPRVSFNKPRQTKKFNAGDKILYQLPLRKTYTQKELYEGKGRERSGAVYKKGSNTVPGGQGPRQRRGAVYKKG